VKDFHVKKPGGWFWTALSRDELEKRIRAGLIQRDWKLWRDGESDINTVDEFLKRTEQPSTGSQSFEQDIEAKPEGRGSHARVVFQILSIYMICSFLWRAFATAHEYPMRFEQVFTISMDLVGVFALIGLRIQIFKSDGSEWLTGNILFWIALFAGVGRLLTRLNGDASWWTGHLFYNI
jgi:hypothetical protein